jgi:hypothetical protein
VGCVCKREDRYWCESTETKEGVRHFHDTCMSSVSSCVDGDCSDERLAPTFIGIDADFASCRWKCSTTVPT